MSTFRLLLSLFTLTILSFAQAPARAPAPAKRIESVRIDGVTCKLTWTVAEGTRDAAGKFTATIWREFSIALDDAFMEELTLARNDAYWQGKPKDRKTKEVRGFDPREAAGVHDVTNALIRYVIDSTIWWDEPLEARPARAARPAQPASLNARARQTQ